AARERGADALVNYASENLTERVMALTDGRGADVCFDPVGGDLFGAALSSLGWGGRILLIGFVAGVPRIPAHRLLGKHRSALGSSLPYFRWARPVRARLVASLFPLARPGQARPLGGRAGRLVRGGKARPLRDPPSAPREEQRGHPPAHGSQGPRQDRRGARPMKTAHLRRWLVGRSSKSEASARPPGGLTSYCGGVCGIRLSRAAPRRL